MAHLTGHAGVALPPGEAVDRHVLELHPPPLDRLTLRPRLMAVNLRLEARLPQTLALDPGHPPVAAAG